MTVSYCEQFAALRSEVRPERWPAATRHRAPHKPLLLLTVIDMIAGGVIDENLVLIDEALFALFKERWHAIVGRPADRSTIGIPAYYLQSEGFWHLIPRDPDRTHERLRYHNDALPLINALTLGVRLDTDLFNLLLDPIERQVAVDTGRNVLRAGGMGDPRAI